MIDSSIWYSGCVFVFLFYDLVLESESSYVSLRRASYFGWSYCGLDCPFDFFASYFSLMGSLAFQQ